MERETGLEPATSSLEGMCSNLNSESLAEATRAHCFNFHMQVEGTCRCLAITMRVAGLEKAAASAYHCLLTERLRTAAGRASGPQRNIVHPAGHRPCAPSSPLRG